MGTLKYTVIKNDQQYNKYCDVLWELVNLKDITSEIQDEIDLLDVLIDKYDDSHPIQFREFDPVERLKMIMEDHKLKAKDLSELLNISKGYISEILNYKKGFSKEIVRKLADRFKVLQEAFNKPYKLKGNKTTRKKNERGKAKRRPRAKSYKQVSN